MPTHRPAPQAAPPPRDEGASAVEFALVAPLLFWLVFGIIGYGVWFADGLSVRDAAVSGARAAALGTGAGATGCRAWGAGWAGATDVDKGLVCTTLARTQLLGSTPHVMVAYTTWDGSAYVPTTDPGVGDAVGVCLLLEQDLTVPMVPLPSDGVQRVETWQPLQSPDAGGVSRVGGHDTDLPSGQDWSWCAP